MCLNVSYDYLFMYLSRNDGSFLLLRGVWYGETFKMNNF
jgi:hypothetical protein